MSRALDKRSFLGSKLLSSFASTLANYAPSALGLVLNQKSMRSFSVSSIRLKGSLYHFPFLSLLKQSIIILSDKPPVNPNPLVLKKNINIFYTIFKLCEIRLSGKALALQNNWACFSQK